MPHVSLCGCGVLKWASELGGTLPYNHGSRRPRPCTELRLENGFEVVGGCDEAALGWIASLKRVCDGVNVVGLDHVGFEGAEQHIEGELREPTLAL